MANYNVTGAGGTTGHPSNGRTPYLVENTIDISAVASDAGTSNGDIIRCIDVPAETLVLCAGVEVLTALSSSATIDIGWASATSGNPSADGDRWIDGDTNATGYGTLRTVTDNATTGLPFGNAVLFPAVETIDATIGGADSSAGKIRVWALMCDVSGIDETDRNTATQHDTTVS